MVSTHTRNVAGMVEHRRNLAIAATRRAELTLDALERMGATVTFALVAQRLGVLAPGSTSGRRCDIGLRLSGAPTLGPRMRLPNELRTYRGGDHTNAAPAPGRGGSR